ncbi:MFS transporter [Iocasia frigidifontis]|uniref:MFS transporter n=1 Tax=Iocasia fonsfrigidae TaxID=2682810 RepID=A0A8A7KJR0_9FIRM|nr:MFS transporter [Iocasia fonsfrigidae]QTL99077.1 MFS transporter [Iocasia fonsfrigidae]
MKVFINKDFFLVWTGQIVSQLGDRLYSIALAWWLLKKTNSPVIMGISLMCSLLPEAIIGLFSGAFIDLKNVKVIMVVTDIIRGLIILLVSCFFYYNILSVCFILIVNIAISVLSALFNPSVMSIIPCVVKKDKVIDANSLSQLIYGLTTVIGPLFGSGLVSWFGFFPVLLFNSFSFIFSGIVEYFIRYNAEVSLKKNILLDEIKKGFSFIRKDLRLIFIMKVISSIHLFVGSLMVVMPFLADDINGNGIINLGFLEMALGLGLILGSILKLSLKFNKGSKSDIILNSFILLGLSFLSLGVIYMGMCKSILPYLFFLIIVGGSISKISVNWRTILQLNVPTDLRGRVFSTANSIANLSLPAGILIYGVLMEYTVPAYVIVLNGLIILSFVLYFKSKLNYEENY